MFFLKYVGDDYDNSFIHRSVPGFVIQGGGFTFEVDVVNSVPTDPPIKNEFDPAHSNVRGTVAMAKVGADPDSATSQWFINLADNSDNLDKQNGGFTVFARVIGDGMNVADAIAALTTVNAGSPLNNLPLISFDSDFNAHPINRDVPNQLVLINRAFTVSDGDGTPSTAKRIYVGKPFSRKINYSGDRDWVCFYSKSKAKLKFQLKKCKVKGGIKIKLYRRKKRGRDMNKASQHS